MKTELWSAQARPRQPNTSALFSLYDLAFLVHRQITGVGRCRDALLMKPPSHSQTHANSEQLYFYEGFYLEIEWKK